MTFCTLLLRVGVQGTFDSQYSLIREKEEGIGVLLSEKDTKARVYRWKTNPGRVHPGAAVYFPNTFWAAGELPVKKWVVTRLYKLVSRVLYAGSILTDPHVLVSNGVVYCLPYLYGIQ